MVETGSGSHAAAPPASASRRFAAGLCAGALCGMIAVSLELRGVVSYSGQKSPLIVLAALAGGLLFSTRLRALVVAAVVALSTLWVVVAFTPLSARLAQPMVRADAIAGDVDAIFVFSSGLQRDGEPTTAAMARLLRGLELLGQRRAPRLILSEIPPLDTSYTALARRWMDRLGVRGELYTVGPVRNTHEEGMGVAALCREHGWHRVIAVSSPTHTRRAAAVLEHEGLEAIAVPSIETLFDLELLDTSDDRLLAFGAALHDRIGYEVYRLRGWIGPAR